MQELSLSKLNASQEQLAELLAAVKPHKKDIDSVNVEMATHKMPRCNALTQSVGDAVAEI